MGLSYLSNPNWPDLLQQQSLEELELDLVCFQDDFTLADTSIDPLFHPPQSQPSTFISHQQPQLPAMYHFDDQVQVHFDQQQQCYYSNKCQKTTVTTSYSTMQDQAMQQSTIEPFIDSQSFGPELIQANEGAWMLPDVTFPPVFSHGSVCNSNTRSGRVGGGLSAQSIAARQRRRKIADKTQELGKIIPGGHKMNTAEMFHSASMYVKFLQAQISILTLTNSTQEGSTDCHDLEHLLNSTMVQEKLYFQEMCLAPQKLVQYLSKDSKLQSDHPIAFQQINTWLMSAQARH